MYVCFYSTNHLGDILLSNPFIKKICESNPLEQFYQWSLYGNELVSGPENLHYLKVLSNDNYNVTHFTSGLAPEDFTENDYLKQLFIKNHHTSIFYFKYEERDYIGLNTWCIPLGCNEDVNHLQLVNGYDAKIKEINQKYAMNLKIDNYNTWDLMPSLKDAPITKFIQWKNNISKDTPLIFIYNYVPRLIHLHFNINVFIKHICNLYHNSIIIVPMYHELLKDIPNIKFCDKDFDCQHVISGTNVLMLNKINYNCDAIISLPTGAAWSWFNTNFKDKRPKIYMIQDSNYVNKLNIWYEYATKEKNIVSTLYLNQLMNII
jgi:hypothetical protein